MVVKCGFESIVLFDERHLKQVQYLYNDKIGYNQYFFYQTVNENMPTKQAKFNKASSTEKRFQRMGELKDEMEILTIKKTDTGWLRMQPIHFIL